MADIDFFWWIQVVLSDIWPFLVNLVVFGLFPWFLVFLGQFGDFPVVLGDFWWFLE